MQADQQAGTGKCQEVQREGILNHYHLYVWFGQLQYQLRNINDNINQFQSIRYLRAEAVKWPRKNSQLNH